MYKTSTTLTRCFVPYTLNVVFVLCFCLLTAPACSSSSDPVGGDVGETPVSDTDVPGEDAGTNELDTASQHDSDIGEGQNSADSGSPDINLDTGVDAPAAEDVSEESDTGPTDTAPTDIGAFDTGEDVSPTDTGPALADAGEPDASDTGTVDAGGTDPYAGRPLGQCTVHDDCPEGPMGKQCTRTFPGGACTGCGGQTHCPAFTSCHVGICTGDCTTDDDCAPGLFCTSTNRCHARSCVDGECPVPLFGCSQSEICVRVDCSDDSSVCPDDTTCTEGLCIEDRAL